MKEIASRITIDAPADRVWRVLTDFGSYPAWSTFIHEISGQPTAGARLRVRLQPPGGRAMTFRPTVLVAAPGRELRWLGHLGVRGLFDGEHVFRLEALDGDRTGLLQSETFRGLLVPLASRGLDKTQHGFQAFNAALKQRVESGV